MKTAHPLERQLRAAVIRRMLLRGTTPPAPPLPSPSNASMQPREKPAAKHDHAAHLAARLTESFQRNQLGETSKGTPSMSTQLTPEARRRAWAKGFGNKRVEASIPVPATETDRSRAAWSKALKRSNTDAPAGPSPNGSAAAPIDRKSAWSKALRQAPVPSHTIKD